jgi:hypothetical protein
VRWLFSDKLAHSRLVTEIDLRPFAPLWDWVTRMMGNENQMFRGLPPLRNQRNGYIFSS